MNISGINKIMNRPDKMIDNAMNGQPFENGFDETKMSALETMIMSNKATVSLPTELE